MNRAAPTHRISSVPTALAMALSIPAAIVLLGVGASMTSCGVRSADARNPQLQSGQSAEPRVRSLTVSGTATLQVLPDVADVHMTLEVERKGAGAAVTELRTRREALLPALKKHGLNDGDIKVSHLSLRPVYERKTGAIRAFAASIQVVVSIRDFERIGQIMEAGAHAQVTRMHSNFRSTRLQELKKRVRDMAMAAAKDKAKQTADAFGVRLGHVASIGEHMAGERWFGTPSVSNEMSFAQPQATGVAPGLQPLTLTMNVVYDLQ